MIIFLYGEDSFRSSRKMLEIKDKFLAADPAGSGLSVFDYDEKNFKESILDTVETPSLLSPKRLLIVKNIIASAPLDEKKEIVEYLKKNEKDLNASKETTLLFWEKNAPKKNDALFKVLESKTLGAKKQNFEKLSGVRLNRWISESIKSINPKAGISSTALEKLAAFAGENTHVLNCEIQKLTDYCQDRIIRDEDVETLVNSNLNISIFNTTDALGRNDKKEASRLLHEHLKQGEDPFYMFSMFVYQFRNLLKVAGAQEGGISGEYAIAKTTGLHPFVVKKSLYQTRGFDMAKLKNIYKKLSELDTKIKTGRIDIKLALDKFIVEL